MTAMQRWLASLLATAVAVVIAYLWIDRPLALLAHRQLAHHETFAQLTHIPDPFAPLAVIVFVGLGLWAFSGRVLSKLQTTALLASLSLVMAEATKNMLKFVFGRTWPETWVRNNPSFIHDGVYGFNPFYGGQGFASFPSGHTAVTCAVISVLWIAYPRWRALYALIVTAVAVGLIGANYHFLSDVIAGGFVGASTGWMATYFWRERKGNDPQ
jgi:membrane-associated phospholipid phosphatase